MTQAQSLLRPVSPEPSLSRNKGELQRTLFTSEEGASLPASIDWEAKGAVTRVYKQGVCAACWSFAATGAMEGAFFIKTGNLTAFSQQNILNCDHHQYDNWCHGTWYGMDSAFSWIVENGGLCTEKDFPYRGNNSTQCAPCSKVRGSKPTGVRDVGKNEAALLAAVAQQPVAVVIDASCPGWMQYKGGVWSKDCGTKLDHAVLVVGYGHDAGKDYWKVKNSMGVEWGERGYIRLERGLRGQGGRGICDIAANASFPIF